MLVLLLPVASCDLLDGKEAGGCLAPQDRRYDDETISYFLEIALRPEYGPRTEVVRKWIADPVLAIHGTPGSFELSMLDLVVYELNQLTGDAIRITVPGRPGHDTAGIPNVDVHFVPSEKIREVIPAAVESGLGYVQVSYEENRIVDGVVAIASDSVYFGERLHVIREEITQMLGLMNDSYTYPESIFYKGRSYPVIFAPIDRLLVEMLYRPEVLPGMNRQEVRSALCTIRK